MAGTVLAPWAQAARPEGTLIESHVHLFANDSDRFPYNSAAYKPRPAPVEDYVEFAREARLDHAVIVHPEPYQDDHRYLEYCLTREPFGGFFKGTCLFDPIDPETPKRLQALVRRNPGRIVALRIHEVRPAGTPSTVTGAIRDRDLRDPRMALSWRAAHELGLSIQMRVYEACGADRMIWGELGYNMAELDRAKQLFDVMFDFAPEPERAKIRGLTSQKLFAFS
jgi:predicted TIM-barrel fold metal-dependent hydrolase